MEQKKSNNNSVIIIVLLLVVGLGGLGFWLATSSQDTSTIVDISSTTEEVAVVDMSGIPDNLEEEIATAIERQSIDTVVVLDVRTDEEWNEAHATDAMHWGLAEHISNGEMPQLDKNTEIYVYCRSGRRATEAITAMQEAGFTDVTNIRGLENWEAAGGQTVNGVDGDEQN